MKLFYLLLLAFSGISVLPHMKTAEPFRKQTTKTKANIVNENARLHSMVEKLRPSLKAEHFCESYCFLADMSIHSGKNRFFVYDLENDSVLHAGLVAHGSGSETESGTLKFSNEPGSLATSLGRYRIGQEYTGKYGLAFKLSGLDKTNSHAYDRVVVLHAHPLVQATEIWPEQTCLSWGCPTVNPSFLLILKKYINDADKPVMLYIFY